MFFQKIPRCWKISKLQNACYHFQKICFFSQKHNFWNFRWIYWLPITITRHSGLIRAFSIFSKNPQISSFLEKFLENFLRGNVQILNFPKYEQSFCLIKFQKNIQTPCFAPPFDADFHSESKIEIKNGGHRAQKKVLKMPVLRHHFFGNS